MDRIKIFMDLEFTGLYQSTELISIGLVSETQDHYYAESSDFNRETCDDWIKDNVLANLSGGDNVCSRDDIAHGLIDYFHDIGPCEIWGDCLAYDWVLFCQLFGSAFGIPDDVYYIPFDICTLMKIKGIDPDISREEFIECPKDRIQKHNALWDAMVIQQCYQKLMRM